jgi:cholesterol transport system auxiliary component
MKMKYKICTLLLCTLSLSSCLSPVKLKPENAWMVNQTPTHLPKKSVRAGTIFVLMPETLPIYNTTQMAYTVMPYQISYYGENRWAETPAQMLQPLIVQTLTNTHYFRAVVTPPFLATYDYTLSTQITKFQINFLRHPAVMQISLRAQLSRGVAGRIISTRDLMIEEPLYENTPYAGVVAANRATSKILARLAAFCIARR